jgi:hypothetical protein
LGRIDDARSLFAHHDWWRFRSRILDDLHRLGDKRCWRLGFVEHLRSRGH